MKPLLYLVALLGVVSSVAADTSAISGHVRQADGQPVAGAQVALFAVTDLAAGALAQATTDDAGYFALPLPGTSRPLPAGFVLGPNYPNPFNPSTIIPYQLPVATPVRLEVFNVLGQHVKTLVEGERPAGAHTALWDATDAAGQAVGAGVYFYRLSGGGAQWTRKMVLVDGQAGVATGGAGWTATARPVETDAPVYGLTVQGAGFAAYVDPAFRVEVGRAPVEVVVEAAHTKRQPEDGLLGDVDGDGRVDIVDALLVAAYAVDPARSASDLDGEGVEDQARIASIRALGDVNGDGVLNLTDAALIGRSSVEPFTPLPAGLGKRAAAASNGTPKMYWTDGSGTIQRANLDGTQIENLITTGRELADLALDVSRGKIYWTDYGAIKIQRANLNGTQIEDLVTDANGLEEPRGLALDVSRGKIYWTDWRTARIQRANLDGTQIENLIITGKWPYSLALDASRGKMYWTDFRTGKIRRVNLDGTQAQDLIITGSVEPAGLALDVGRGKMYWTDSLTGKIQRANLDGTQIETLTTTGSVRPAGLALDVGRGKMYWTDSLTGKIQRANLNGTQIETLTTGTGSRAGWRGLGDIVLDTSGAGTVPIESSDEGDDGGDGGDDDSGSSDDYSNTRSGATSLAVDGSRSGRLETGGDVDFFQVQVSRSGTLTVYTTSSTDTYGTLQNSSGSNLATNDDGGRGQNFSIARSVSAGTYYIQVRGFSSSTTGSYTVHARFQSGGGGGGDALSTSISLSASPHTISEDAAVTEIVLTATLDKALDADATVTISVDPNSEATRDVDYSALFNPLLIIPAGSTSGSVSLLIDPTTDRENEGNETITLTASTPGLTSGSAQITISDHTAEPDDPGAAPLAFAEGASVDDQQYTAGTAIDALELPEASVGTGTIRYSISELPAGLSFDAATRTISGTPEAATEAVKITYTATAGSESVSLTFSIKVNPITVVSTPPPPPSSGACYVGQVVRPNESCTLGGGELRNIGEGCLVYTPLGSVRFCSSSINVNGLRATRSGNDFTIEVVP